MKPSPRWFVTALSITVAIVALAIPMHLKAQNQAAQGHHHYKLVDLGTFGGPASYLSNGFDGILNNQGTLVGWADTPTPELNPAACVPADCFVVHAFESRNGILTDLGALPGGDSSQPTWISASGLIVGVSQIDETDPSIPGGPPEVRAVLWRHGKLIDLGLLPEGGFDTFASAVNSGGQVAGWGLNTISDPFSLAAPGFFATQTRAFLWQNGTMHDLGTLGGSDALATNVNNRGQVAGMSYVNSTPNPTTGIPTQDPFLWENGTMLDLGTLGGTLGGVNALNDNGDVVGVSNLTGDQTSHPFLWTKGGGMQDLGTLGGNNGITNWINNTGVIAGKADLPGPLPQNHDAVLWKNGAMTDLGTLPSDSCSNAYFVNSRGQVVGTSENRELCLVPTGEHAFLWEDGSAMVDLNTLIPAGSSLQLTFAVAINDREEIAGFGVPSGCLPQNVEICGHAFVLIPCDANHPGIEGCDYSMVNASAAANEQSTNETQPLAAASQNTLSPSEMNRNRRFGSIPTPTQAVSGKESAQVRPTSTGGIVYTPTNVTITGDGSIKLDLNHDGITDFTITASDGYSMCYFANEFHGTDTLFPATGNGVVASDGSVTALGSGTLVGSSDSFQTTQTLIGSFVFGPGFPPCLSYLRGWCHGTISSKSCSKTAYMGLEFKINGQVHYGWAYLEIYAAAPGSFNTTLKGFAYESVAGRAITTGQTSGY